MVDANDDADAGMTPDDAAVFLGCSTRLLAKWRSEGGGPAYIRLSHTRVVYTRRQLVEFMRERTYRSTSDERSGGGGSGGGSAKGSGA